MQPQNVLIDPALISSGLEITFKILFVVAAIIYVLFTLIVMRQISLMKKTLITPVSPVIGLLGFVHFCLAVGVLVFYIVVL